MLLAACGGGSGGNLTTASETESEPPVTGSPLVALSSSEGDGEQQPESESDGDGEQGKNVQPENDQESEEEESESEEEENNNNEEAPQQLTIIEEEDFPYVPPEEEEPRYSAQTQTQTQTQTSSLPAPDPTIVDSSFNCMTNYVLDDCTANLGPRSSSFTGTTINYILENSAWTTTFKDLEGKDRGLQASSVARNVDFNPANSNYNFDYKNINRLKKVEVTYSKTNGFEGFYTYKGTAYGSSTATQKDDVTLKATFYNKEVSQPLIEGSIGGSDGLAIGSTNFGNITFTAQGNENGQFTVTNISFSNSNIRTEAGFNEVKGSFKNDGSSSNFPSQVVGELKMKRFFDQSSDKSSDEYRNNLYLRGENAIAGVFLADRGNEVVKEHQTSSQTPSQSETPSETQATLGDKVTIDDKVTTTLMGQFSPGPTGGGAFPFGIWASEKLMGTEHRIAFLELSSFLNPTTRPGHYTPHQNNNADVRYEREDGFKGAYIYEGETGELTGDVELKLQFSSNSISVSGNISSDLEIEGNNLNGIILTLGDIDSTTGVGIYTSGETHAVAFGNADLSSQSFDLTTMHDLGQVKLRMILSPDGRHARAFGKTSQPESYPSYVAGEVEINGFKINADDRDTNTVVGVFIGDKQE